jgi:hypothetical protein
MCVDPFICSALALSPLTVGVLWLQKEPKFDHERARKL